ncbi:MAG: hypothetical protein Q8O57_05085, partial [Kiritimatiellota bacterium]|nr:hypothetical protein [Kiritimatiellota bacterium]
MTERERYLRYMHYQPVDYPPLRLVGPWPETLERWYAEGLPRGMDPHEYLGVKAVGGPNVSGEIQMFPWAQTRVLHDNDDNTIEIDEWGRTVRKFKHTSTTPEWIDYPVKEPADLRRIIDEGFAVDQASLDARFAAGWE